MTREQKKYVNAIIEKEGFDYAFRDYSSFEDIGDSEFHKLRKKYIKAALDLQEYIEK